MKPGLRNALSAGVAALIIATGPIAVPAFAFGHCSRHVAHHHAFSLRGWPDRYARVSSYWRPRGYGCGPFADNQDGWDIGWHSTCYVPTGY